jgi:hypothetical protein
MSELCKHLYLYQLLDDDRGLEYLAWEVEPEVRQEGNRFMRRWGNEWSVSTAILSLPGPN